MGHLSSAQAAGLAQGTLLLAFLPTDRGELLDPITALTHYPRMTPLTRLGPGMGLCPHRSG